MVNQSGIFGPSWSVRGRDELCEFRQMHREWKKKLEAETVEGELSDSGG